MRKVLSFVLVLSLVLGSFGMCFAATATTPSDKKLSDIDGLACEDAVRVLTSLDVVSGYEDGTYKPEQTVTRAEMASLVIKSLGLKETDAVPKFADSKNHWAKGYIAYANTLGIISGRSETVFDPDATVTYDEATTMLIKALGYTDESLNGTYPASFVSRAKVLGILDDIQTGSGGANRGDIAIMLYQTLDQSIGKVDKDGNFTRTVISAANATPVKYDTMLERLGAKMYNVGGYYDNDDENFIVTGDEDSVINLTPYKGALVSAYMNSDKEIIAIKEIFSSFVSGTIKSDVLTTADGTEYTLKAEALADIGATTTASAVMFKNGETVGSYPVSTAEGANYTMAVDLTGKKISEVYSVTLWTVNADGVLEADDVADIKSNHKLLGIDFDEDNNEDIDLDTFELIGVDSLDDIKADMVAYVYKTASDNNISRIAVGPTQKVTGEVSKVNSGGTKVTIDGKTYKYAVNELAGNGGPGEVGTDAIKAGDEVELTLDAYGYIYDSEKTSSKADKFAIVLKTENKETGKISADAKIKLFLADGTHKIFTVDEDEIEDAAIISTGSSVTWTANVTTGAIVRYGLDKDGVITSLNVDGAASNAADDLLFTTGRSNISSKGYFASKTVAKNAVLFNYTANNFATPGALSDDEDDYGVTTYDKALDSDTTDAYYVYDTKNKEIVAMLLNDVASADDVFGLVNSKGKNNSDAGAYYNMLIDGKEVTYNGTESNGADKYGVSTSSTSAIYMIKFDSNGDIKSFDPWSGGSDEKYSATMTMNASTTAVYNNRTFNLTGNTLAITPFNIAPAGSGSLGAATTTASITIDSDVVVYVYDKQDDEWQLGSTSDLRSLKVGAIVNFYDAVDEDGIFDIVTINNAGTI